MRVTNWFEISEETPQNQGDYLVICEKIKNSDELGTDPFEDADTEEAVFLKKGDLFVLESGPEEDDDISKRILFIFETNKKIVQIKEDGFYALGKSGRREYLQKMNVIYWSPNSSSVLHQINNAALEKYNSSKEDLSISSLTKEIKPFEDKDPYLADIKSWVADMFDKNIINIGGVSYYVNKENQLAGYLDALKIRNLISKISEFKDRLYLENLDKLSMEEIYALRLKLEDYLRYLQDEKYVKITCDGYFFDHILPKKDDKFDFVRGLAEDNYNIRNQKLLEAGVYLTIHRCKIVGALATHYASYVNRKDRLAELALLKDLSVNMAISRGQIVST